MAQSGGAVAPGGDDLHPSGPLVLAATLAAVSGYLDAFLFLHVAQVFVANMSGNVVLFGMTAGQRDFAGAAGPGMAIVAFVAGMATATKLHDRRRRQGLALRPDLLVLVELGLVAVVVALVVGLDDDLGTVAAGAATWRDLPVVAVGGFAMGVQTAVLRRVGAISVSTTYESGIIARIAEESVLLTEADRTEQERATRRRVVFVLGWLVIAYAAGAALAAALGPSVLVLAGPVIALLAVAGVSWRRRPARAG